MCGSDNESQSYTYSVSGSTVTIYEDDDEVFRQLIYSSGQLVRVLTIYTPEGSSVSGNSIRLAGTTWTYSFAGTDDYDQSCTYTYTIKFESDGTATSYSYKDSELMNAGTASYTVNGSTVVFSYGSNEATYIYFSGKLIYGAIYTKD